MIGWSDLVILAAVAAILFGCWFLARMEVTPEQRRAIRGEQRRWHR